VLLCQHGSDEAVMAARLGKMPTTSVRRRISLLRRSSGLLDQIWRQWVSGKGGERQDLISGVGEQRGGLGKTALKLIDNAAMLGPDLVGAALGEDGPHQGRDHRLVRPRHPRENVASEVVLQRCHVASSTDASASTRP
jgi:hypothetical protein